MTAQEQTHNTVMGSSMSVATLAAGQDFIGAGMDAVSGSSEGGSSESGARGAAERTATDGMVTFSHFGGGTARYNTGSHVRTNTWNAILGVGKKNEGEKTKFSYAAFFEYGTGHYRTYDNANGVDNYGNGNTDYTGGGLFAKWEQKQKNYYVEGSLRAGRVTDDATNVMHNPETGEPYSYKTHANYYGFHIGVGKILPLTKNTSLDIYGKYYHTHRQGTDFTLASGSRYDLDATNSNILRIGARYTIKRAAWEYYGGVAWDYEFSGESTGRVTAAGLTADIRAASIRGGSVRGELGVKYAPEKLPWNADLTVTAYGGKHEGLAGGVKLTYLF